MKFTLTREELLHPLQLVSGVVERRQSLPILANVLMHISSKELCLIGTDYEVELQGRSQLSNPVDQKVTLTAPGRKLLEICRTLPENCLLECNYEEPKLTIRSGRSRFSLSTLSVRDFPKMEFAPGDLEFSVAQKDLRKIFDQTRFAMADQDVRYYLNGVLFEVKAEQLKAVATDGHRLAVSVLASDAKGEIEIILPRKGVLELVRLLANNEEQADIIINATQIAVKTSTYTFTSKLIDGRYPDYNKVIPKNVEKTIVLDRDLLKQTLERVAVLSGEKQRTILLEFKENALRMVANNPEQQEEAEEEITIDYQGAELTIAFNVNYLLEILATLPSGEVKIFLANANSGMRIEAAGDNDAVYVVMPMML